MGAVLYGAEKGTFLFIGGPDRGCSGTSINRHFRDGVISRAEWLAYHKTHLVSYNGVADDGGYLGAGNYNGEFNRVDCEQQRDGSLRVPAAALEPALL